MGLEICVFLIFSYENIQTFKTLTRKVHLESPVVNILMPLHSLFLSLDTYTPFYVFIHFAVEPFES